MTLIGLSRNLPPSLLSLLLLQYYVNYLYYYGYCYCNLVSITSIVVINLVSILIFSCYNSSKYIPRVVMESLREGSPKGGR